MPRYSANKNLIYTYLPGDRLQNVYRTSLLMAKNENDPNVHQQNKQIVFLFIQCKNIQQ